MKTKYIVYYHYTVFGNVTVNGYSPAEAQHIIEKRMKKRGDLEPGVDKVVSLEEEKAINDAGGVRKLC